MKLIIESSSKLGKPGVFTYPLQAELTAEYLFDILVEFYEQYGDNIILRIYKE